MQIIQRPRMPVDIGQEASPSAQARQAIRESLTDEMVRTSADLRRHAEEGNHRELQRGQERLLEIAAQLRALEAEDRAMEIPAPPAPPAPGVTIVPPPFPGNEVQDIPENARDVAILFFIATAATIILTPIARAFARAMDRRGAQPRAMAPEVDARLARMEQAIDAVAIEVERIAEGQRFATRLLADRERVAEPR